MKQTRAVPHLSPVIAAARLRAPRHQRGARKKTQNNYIAERRVSPGPAKGNRKGAGAPPANDNAVTHGAQTAASRGKRAFINQLCREARLLLAMRKALVALQQEEAR